MNDITLDRTTLTVAPRGADRWWSLRRHIVVPLSHVRGATFDPGADHEPGGLRMGGLALPGKWAGTFRRDGEKTFWNVSRSGSTIVVELRDEKFRRMMLTVDEPRELVDRINASIRV